MAISNDVSFSIFGNIIQEMTSLQTPNPPNINPTKEKQQHDEGELLAGFLGLATLIAEAGIGVCILIDRIEAGSEAVQSGMKDLVARLPSTSGIVLACNDETPEGLKALNNIEPSVAYAQGLQVRLPGLTLDDFEEWIRDVKVDSPNTDELRQVLSNCDGRPLFLRDWVAGLSVDATRSVITKRVGAYYDRRIASLSPPARQLLRFLSIMPSRSSFAFEVCDTVLHTQPNFSGDSFDVLEELVNKQFLERGTLNENGYKFVHEVTRNYVLDHLPKPLISTGANILLEALDLHKMIYTEPHLLYTQVTLLNMAGRRDELLDIALPTAKKLSHYGSYGLAKEI